VKVNHNFIAGSTKPPADAVVKVFQFSEQVFGIEREIFDFISTILYKMPDECKFHKALLFLNIISTC
jgi:hypothetical protein